LTRRKGKSRRKYEQILKKWKRKYLAVAENIVGTTVQCMHELFIERRREQAVYGEMEREKSTEFYY